MLLLLPSFLQTFPSAAIPSTAPFIPKVYTKWWPSTSNTTCKIVHYFVINLLCSPIFYDYSARFSSYCCCLHVCRQFLLQWFPSPFLSNPKLTVWKDDILSFMFYNLPIFYEYSARFSIVVVVVFMFADISFCSCPQHHSFHIQRQHYVKMAFVINLLWSPHLLWVFGKVF